MSRTWPTGPLPTGKRSGSPLGNRATLVIVPPQTPRDGQPVTALCMHCHWSGRELPQRVAQGIYDGRPRWDVPAYMTRVLVCAALADDLDAIDGYGLGLMPFGLATEEGRPFLVVDVRRQRVGFLAAGKWPLSEADCAHLPWDYDAAIGELADWP